MLNSNLFYRCLFFILLLFLDSCTLDYGQPMMIAEESFSSAWQEEPIPADKGWIRVPDCRNDQGCTDTIRIPFVRLKSTSDNPGDPVFYLAGGPGDSGIGSGTRGIFAYLSAYRKLGDVVLFDQRGTGDARPDLQSEQSFAIPADVSLADPEALESMENLLGELRLEMEQRDINLDHYNTRENAFDIDSLRSGLGYERINLLAHSYGTHLALAYIKYFEGRVNRVVLSGANGLNHRLILPEDSEAFIRRLYGHTRRHSEFSRIYPDFLESVERVLQKYREGLTIGDSLHFNSFDIMAVTMLRSGDADFVYSLPGFYKELGEEDFETFAEILHNQIKNRPVGTVMTYAVSSASVVSEERRQRIQGQSEGALMGNARNYPFYQVDFRRHLDIPGLGEEFRQLDTMAVPALFINGTLDGRTPPEDANRVRAYFSNSSQIKVVGASHEVLFSNPELIELSTAFLNGTDIGDRVLDTFYRLESLQGEEIMEELTRIYKQSGIMPVLVRINEMRSENSQYYLSPEILIHLGDRLMENEQYGDALELIETGMDLFPDVPMLINSLGVAHLRLGNTDKAIQFARQFTEAYPFDRRWAFYLNSQGISLTD